MSARSRGTGEVEQKAREAHRSPAVESLARLGLAARGVVWLVVALLALSVLLGGGRAEADSSGALRVIAERSYGAALLVVLAIGFAGYALSLALSAAVGRDDAGHRAKQAAKAVLYLLLAVSAVQFLLGSGESGDRASTMTARLMQAPGGRLLAGLVGLALVGLGVVLGLRALRQDHAKKIRSYRVPRGWSQTVLRIGTVGLLGRAAAVVLIGGFLLLAAVRANPREAKGVDAVLQALAAQPHGKVFLALAVLALLAYAVWSFCEAAFHRRES